MTSVSKRIVWGVVLIPLALAVGALLIRGLITTDNDLVNEHRYEAEKRLKFKLGSPYVRIDGERTEVWCFERVFSGPLSEAGVIEGDLPFPQGELGKTMQSLVENDKEAHSFLVVPGGNGPELSKRVAKRITINP